MSRPYLRPWTLAVVIGAAGALGLAACSSSPSHSSASSNVASTSYNTGSGPSATTTTVNGAIAPIPTADLSPAGTAGTAPTLKIPTELQSADLITGVGVEATSGDNVTVQYVLGTYSSGKVVQSSWTSQPFSFTLGAGQVIPGWDQGVVGMKLGGRRELIIPPSLGYGARSPGAGIAPNDTLVFVIDLLKIN